MQGYYKGEPIFGSGGGGGVICCNPIGTVISFMGTAAPKDYLICDGAEYRVSEYPALANFFRQQFGTAGHFGGDGETSFAVPDMRNLFLRGYHGEAEEQLSGEIGERQRATLQNNIVQGVSTTSANGYYVSSTLGARESYQITDPDTEIAATRASPIFGGSGNAFDVTDGRAAQYTARPINMAVLYCIKAAESTLAEGGGESAGSGQEVYSTEERRIGTWIDGKPLYQRVVHWEGTFDTDSTRKALPITAITTESLVSCYGSIRAKDWPISVPFADTSSSNFAYTEIWNSFLYLSTRLGPSNTITEVNVMLTYTKTTD